MELLYLITGLIIGGLVAWFIASSKAKTGYVSKSEFDDLSASFNEKNTELNVEKEKSKMLNERINELSDALDKKTIEFSDINTRLASKTTECDNYKTQLDELKFNSGEYELTLGKKQQELNELNGELMLKKANLDAMNNTNMNLLGEREQLKKELDAKTIEFNELNSKYSALNANFNALNEKLDTHKKEMEELRIKFNTEFENIAAKILDDKSQKFTKQNQESLLNILKPFGDNINEFKKKVEDAYEKESNERFSLGKEVEKLVQLNKQVSEEANNLTKALKGNSKTQGDWGQMILENILEMSGLTRDREYIVQGFLKDDDGNYMRKEDGSKMQPDVIVSIPGNRKVIIDSKVSLTAYARYCSADDKDEQKRYIDEHIRSVKTHVNELSNTDYHDYRQTLDFIMMFIPNEPAYMLAMQTDSEIWGYAYRKKILLVSPTNLIAALKLIEDLWKREYQNRNAMEIAERGSALYDKFVSFVENLQEIGNNLSKAQRSYDDALKQLKDGSGNLIGQAEKLKKLGVKTKKNLPQSLLNEALLPPEDENIFPKELNN